MNKKLLNILSLLFSVAIISVALVYSKTIPESLDIKAENSLQNTVLTGDKNKLSNINQSEVDGVEIPIKWGDLGVELVESGVIDSDKFISLYESRGGLNDYEKNLLYGDQNDVLKINEENASYVLNLLWALGLGNKNDILEHGEMMDSQYGGAGNFASTGGWTIAKGDAMEYYSKFNFVTLTPEQQKLVDEVSRNIYRPCCGNSTHFPDCNHGMAMLGLLELMASQNISEADMYKYALKVNELWFPSNYATVDKYLKTEGLSIDTANPKDILSNNYSSAGGYRNVLSKVNPVTSNGGNGCGV